MGKGGGLMLTRAMNHSRRPIFLLCALLLLGGTRLAEAAATMLSASGRITASLNSQAIPLDPVLSKKQEATKPGETNNISTTERKGGGVNLPPGTVITTSEDGTAIIELAPGVLIQLQKNTEIVIGEIIPNGAQDSFGNSIDLATVTVNTGVISTVITDAAIATTGLSVITPRGSTSPTVAGQAVIMVTGVNPDRAVVTVASILGSELVTTESGEQISVGEGLAVILRPDGEYEVLPIDELPDAAGIRGIAAAAAGQMAGMGSPVVPPLSGFQLPPDNGVPPNQPPAVPTPTPSPPPISP